AGGQFLYGEGNDGNSIVHWARLGPILLTIFLIWFVYRWSKELMGPWWALIPSLMLVFSPMVLAHGHYVTTDLAAATGIVVAFYYFLQFLKQPIRSNVIKSGLAFGFAQVC